MSFVLRLQGYIELPDTFRGELPELLERIATLEDVADPASAFRASVDDRWRHHVNLTAPTGSRINLDTILQREDGALALGGPGVFGG